LADSILNFFKGKKILITGASGFIASNLLNTIKNSDCTIIRLSREKSFSEMNGKANIYNFTGDVSSIKIWDHVLKDIDIIFHLAAQTSVYVANDKPLDDFKVNVLPMINLLEKCRIQKIKPIIIFTGTVTEAGIPKRLPVNETHEDLPVTIYDLHKLMAENYLKYYSLQQHVYGVALRLANVYGPGPKSSSSDRSIMNMMMRKALAKEPLTIYGKGRYLRDYIYVDDVISALLHAAAHIDRLNGRHFVIGSGQGYSIAQSINLVASRAALKTRCCVPVQHIAPPLHQSPIELRDFIADSRKFSSKAEWRAYYTLKEGIDKTLDAKLRKTN